MSQGEYQGGYQILNPGVVVWERMGGVFLLSWGEWVLVALLVQLQLGFLLLILVLSAYFWLSVSWAAGMAEDVLQV